MVLDAVIADRLLTNLGFLHVAGPPRIDGRAYLFVALRPKPTLRHFDPERVDFWLPDSGRGTRATVDRSSRPGRSTFAWGAIRVVDRKAVENEFSVFGGSLEVKRFEGEVVAVFSSDAPIAARGGRSQGRDLAADEMAAFFARLRAAVGADRSLENFVCRLTPVELYCGFLADAINRHRDQHGEIVGDLSIVQLVSREAARLRCCETADWQRGAPLAEALA